jgi:hypothetical protein
MIQDSGVVRIVREHKTLFVIIAVVLFLLELEIFAVAVMKSGRKSLLQVTDSHGNVIHEADGDNLSQFNKYYFEKTFGPLDNYDVKLITREKPFPFRAWFAAAVGLPVGVVLLFAFIVKAYTALFYGDPKKTGPPGEGTETHNTRLEKILYSISRFNVFTIGFLIFLAIFAYWVVPNFVAYIGRVGLETILRFKWIFLGIAVVITGIGIWIIYLRYLLAKKTIETQAEVEKQRIQLQLEMTRGLPLQLEHTPQKIKDDPQNDTRVEALR